MSTLDERIDRLVAKAAGRSPSPAVRSSGTPRQVQKRRQEERIRKGCDPLTGVPMKNLTVAASPDEVRKVHEAHRPDAARRDDERVEKERTDRTVERVLEVLAKAIDRPPAAPPVVHVHIPEQNVTINEVPLEYDDE